MSHVPAGQTEARLVLVVEDDSDLVVVLRRLLRRTGLDSVCASTGREAVTLFAGTRPDLVLLDLGLPDMDGSEVLAALRRTSDVPVLVLTAQSGAEDGLSTADGHLTKPFHNDELVAMSLALLARGHDPGGGVDAR